MIVEELPAGTTLADYKGLNLELLRSLPTFIGPFETEGIRLPGGSSVQLRYRTEIRKETGSYVVATLQYLLVDEGKGFVVTYSALPRFVDDYLEEFRASARTFRLY